MVAPMVASTKPKVATNRPRGGRGASIARAYEQVRAMIVLGKLAPGTRIIESDIADHLGLSRTPVRSALHRLQQEGYVSAVDRPKEKRLVVAPLTQSDARELFLMVGQLEGLAARLAAELPARERAALVTQLRALNGDLASAGRAIPATPQRYFELDMAFHHSYVAAAAGPRLLALHEGIKPQAERYTRLYVSALGGAIGTSVEEHEVINRAIESGDADGAQRSVETNWRNAADRLADVISEQGEIGRW
jgi:DNA-binding GntR family transcriptional regulator